MERLYVPLNRCGDFLKGSSKNAVRLKQIREQALSEQTQRHLQDDPYLEIWDVDYYSTSDEEDNDSGKESEDEDEESSDENIEVNEEAEDQAAGEESKGEEVQ